jgi:hypothetical protein
MKSDKYLWEKVVLPIYKEMYRKATPKADIDKLIKDGTTKEQNWFYQYYLPMKDIEEIEEKHCKLHKLNKYEKKKIHFETMLGASPCSSKKRWIEEREKNRMEKIDKLCVDLLKKRFKEE